MNEITTQRAQRRPWVMLAVATLGFALNFWAWALLSPLGPLFRTAGHARPVVRVRRRAAGRRTGAGRLAGPDPGRRADRPVRRPGDVPAGVGGDDRPDPVHRLLRARLVRRAAGRRLLPRHRRYRLRGRRTVRERLVPARAPGPRGRHLRRGHGRYGDQRADHREAVQQRRPPDPVPASPRLRPGRRTPYSRGWSCGTRRTGGRRRDRSWLGWWRTPSSRSAGRPASCTPSRSAAMWPSRSTCRRT